MSLSSRLVSGQHLSLVLEKDPWQVWDPKEGRNSGALEVSPLSRATLVCAEKEWLRGCTLRWVGNQENQAQR